MFARWLFPLALVACSVPKDAGFPDVRETVVERSGARAVWNQGTSVDRAVVEAMDSMLSRPLTLDSAITIALLNNSHLQAAYEELGVAQADLVKAGMVANPKLGGLIQFPLTGGSANVDAGVGFNFLSLLTRSARVRVAEQRFEATKLEVADVVLRHIAMVKGSFVAVQAAQQLEQIDLALAQAAQGAYDTAKGLHDAGNISDLRLAREQALYEQARMEWLDSQGRVVTTRERLNRLLGLWGENVAWTIEESLRGVPAELVALDQLESRAIAQRLDLAAAKRRTGVVAAALRLSVDWSWLHGLDAGAELARETDGGLSLGPSVELELPIFDQGQADDARLRAELRRSYRQVTALAVDIRSHVRERRAELLRRRRKAIHYREVVIPLHEQIVAETMRHYNFMLVGVFELLEEKRREQEAYHRYVEETRDYWVARAELERVVGGRL